MTNNQKLALEAVNKFMGSLTASDFVTAYGTKATQGIKEYQLDIALDIAEVFDGRRANEAEVFEMSRT
jgi:hypothetical protein